ncbi:hypothetical protein K7N18_04950 [Burkholderia arboris]|uniref:hypothetical protein n=1 Tax=Burkholderia arboris TaxID=488730 RepID=UPI001CA3D289|nr:hypothetical protein [Burkholderia arboris]MBY8604175.1 hypothetical protein [Burkholderia arboris]
MMSTIQSTILTPGWWISSVIGVVLLGLVGMYVKDGIDKLLKLIRGKWAHRSELARNAFEEEVARLRADVEMRNRYFQDETRNRMRTTLGTVQSVMNLLLFLVFCGFVLATEHGYVGEVSRSVTIAAFVLSVVTGLGAIVASATAMVAHLRASKKSDRLTAAQRAVSDDPSAT